MKKIVVIGIAVLTLVTGAVAVFAASQYSTPAEAVAGLTGRDVQNVIDERAKTGKTYGTIAKDAGVLDAFRAEMLGIKKDRLAARIADGTLTEEQAEDITARLNSAQDGCDGSGAGCELHGAGLGLGFGQCLKQGSQEQVKGQGDQSRVRECRRIGSESGFGQNGRGQGGGCSGGGARLRDGSCVNQ